MTHSDARVVVLVHGAWHGAWCWSGVQDALDLMGVPSVAVDLPSVTSGGDLHADADAVIDDVEAQNGPVILCGHSYGGCVITEAGLRNPKVEGLIYVAALMPDESESANDLVGQDPMPAFTRALRFSRGKVEIDKSAATDVFYSDCDVTVAGESSSRLRAQSTLSLRQRPKSVAWRDVPSVYLRCVNDRAVSPVLQERLALRASQRRDWFIGHCPFLTEPSRLAQLLVELSLEVTWKAAVD